MLSILLYLSPFVHIYALFDFACDNSSKESKGERTSQKGTKMDTKDSMSRNTKLGAAVWRLLPKEEPDRNSL